MALSHLTCWQEKWKHKKDKAGNPAARTEGSGGRGKGTS